MRITIDVNGKPIRVMRIIRRSPLENPADDHLYEVYLHGRDGEIIDQTTFWHRPSDPPLLMMQAVAELLDIQDNLVWSIESRGTQYDPLRWSDMNTEIGGSNE